MKVREINGPDSVKIPVFWWYKINQGIVAQTIGSFFGNIQK